MGPLKGGPSPRVLGLGCAGEVGGTSSGLTYTSVVHWLSGHALAGPKPRPCRLDISLPVSALCSLCLRACWLVLAQP